MIEKGSKDWEMFADYFNLCRKFWDVPEKDDSYYDALMEEAKQFQQKYESGDGFARSLHDALVDRVQKVWRERYGTKEEKAG